MTAKSLIMKFSGVILHQQGNDDSLIQSAFYYF